MARGRMITNLICKDKKVHSLSDDTCRLLFTWLITVADCEGRTYGDPAIVKSTIFPRRNDITTERVDGYLNEMFMVGLITRYIVDDEQYICFPAFEKNQVGLRKDREAKSEIPAPPIRNNSGVVPDEIQVNRIEVNGIEVKEKEDISSLDSFTQVQKWLEEITGLIPTGQPSIEAINQIIAMGANRDDIQNAYNWFRDNTGKHVKYYGQLVNSIRTEQAKRVQAKAKVSNVEGFAL